MSSMDGYCTFVTFEDNELGEPLSPEGSFFNCFFIFLRTYLIETCVALAKINEAKVTQTITPSPISNKTQTNVNSEKKEEEMEVDGLTPKNLISSFDESSPNKKRKCENDEDENNKKPKQEPTTESIQIQTEPKKVVKRMTPIFLGNGNTSTFLGISSNSLTF